MERDPIREAMEQPEFFLSASAVPSRPKSAPRPAYGAARMATADELRALLSDPEEPGIELPHVAPLVESASGLRLLPKERLHLDRELCCRNLLAVGQVGSGKSMNVIVPAVFGAMKAVPDATLVVADLKGDLYDTIGAHIDRHGIDVDLRCLNFTDPRRSEAYNPYDPENDTDSYNATRTLLDTGEAHYHSGSRFFFEWAVKIICAAQHCSLREYGWSSPALMYQQVEQPTETFLAFLKRQREHEDVWSVVEFLRNSHQNSDTAMAEARVLMSAWRDPNLCAVTGRSELRLRELVGWPTVLVVEVDQGELARSRGMLRTFFSQLQRYVAHEARRHAGNRLPRPLFLFLDEFASMGRIPNLPQFLNTNRSRNVSVMAAVQTLSQIHSTYGAEGGDVLAAFSSKVFLSPVDHADAEYASCLSGTMTVGRSSDPVRQAPRRLLVPEEIYHPPVHPLLGRAATMFVADRPPFYCYLRPGYDTPGIRESIAEVRSRPRPQGLRPEPLVPCTAKGWLEFVDEQRKARDAAEKSQGEFMSKYEDLFGSKGARASSGANGTGASDHVR